MDDPDPKKTNLVYNSQFKKFYLHVTWTIVVKTNVIRQFIKVLQAVDSEVVLTP